MDQKGGALFSTLLVQLPLEKRKRTLSYLPKEALSVLCDAEEPLVRERFPSILTSEGWFHKIHYSWFGEVLKKMPPKIQSHFIALFPPEIAKKLGSLLGVSPKSSPHSPFTTHFLLAKLKELVVPNTVISEELLAIHPLNELLLLSKNELTALIDLLGVHDVIAEIKKIVDKTVLEMIHDALLPKQLSFLKNCSKRQTKWSPPPLNLSKWDGDRKKLLNTIHERGLIRFAYALGKENESLVWHLTHVLDTGRAKKILSHIDEMPDNKLLSYFRKQMLEAKEKIR